MELAWDDLNAGETDFVVLRGPSSAGVVPIGAVSGDATTYRDSTAEPGAAYVYAVAAAVEGVQGAFGYVDSKPETAAIDPVRVPESAIVFVSGTVGGTRSLLSQGTDGRSRIGKPITLASAEVEDRSFGQAAISPDGTKVVFISSLSPLESVPPIDLYVAAVNGSDDPVQLTSMSGQEIQPSWSSDGASVLFAHLSDVGYDDTGDLFTVPTAGGAPTPVPGGVDKSQAVFVPGTTNIVAVDDDYRGMFGRTRLVTISDSGTTAVMPGSLDLAWPAAAPDGSKIAAVLSHGDALHGRSIAVLPVSGGTPKKITSLAPYSDPKVERSAYDEAPEWGDTGDFIHFTRWEIRTPINGGAPVEGRGLASVRPDGTDQVTSTLVKNRYEEGPSVTTTDRWGPVAQMTTPVSLGTTVQTFTLRWKAVDPGNSGVASYDVMFYRYDYKGTKAVATLVADTTATSRTQALKAGYTYCFFARAKDSLGNQGGWSAPRCIATARDDRLLGKSTGGWTTNTSSSYLAGSAVWSAKAGAYVVRTNVKAKQIGLVVRTCNTCGSVNVYIGSTKIGSLSTKSSSPSFQKTLWLPATKSALSGNLKIQSISSARVFIDGVFIRAV